MSQNCLHPNNTVISDVDIVDKTYFQWHEYSQKYGKSSKKCFFFKWHWIARSISRFEENVDDNHYLGYIYNKFFKFHQDSVIIFDVYYSTSFLGVLQCPQSNLFTFEMNYTSLSWRFVYVCKKTMFALWIWYHVHPTDAHCVVPFCICYTIIMPFFYYFNMH